jgi:cytochrome c553
MSHRIWIGAVLLTGVVVGCATIEQLAPPVEQVAPAPGQLDDTTALALQHGRDLYLTKCVRCHRPLPITAYGSDQWRLILPRMATEARLSDDEHRALAAYINAVRAASERVAAAGSLR